MRSHLEDSNEANDWKTTNSHECELVMVYDNYNENNTLGPKIFFALYIRLNDHSNSHLIFKLSTKQILATINWQPIHAPGDLIEAINEEDLFNNKIQTNYFDSDHFILQDNHSDKYRDDIQNHFYNENNSEDENYDELDNSQQINDMESNTIIDQEDQVLLVEGSNNSTSVSATGLTSVRTCLQGLFLQYLHKIIVTTLCLRHLYKGITTAVYILLLLQMCIQVSVREDILHHLYKGIYTTIYLR